MPELDIGFVDGGKLNFDQSFMGNFHGVQTFLSKNLWGGYS